MIEIQEIINNPDLTKNIIVNHEGRSLRMHSSRPHAEAEKIFQQLNPHSSVYFIVGIGCGYLIEKILNDSSAMCIIYEPLSIIWENIYNIRPELKSILTQKRIIIVHTQDQLTQVIQEHKISDLSFNINRVYYTLFSEECDQIKELISANIRKQNVSNATLLRFGKIWTKNLFRNMHRFFYSQKLISYISWAKQKPAVIIGAGPSLEGSIDYLKQHQEGLILIACDTALPILYHHKINPDFVVTVDPQEKNSLYLRYTPNKNHILIADPAVHDSSFENYSDNNIILMDSIFPLYKPFERFWGPRGLLASGGSVSTSAFDFARHIQADPIILVGQDLSFSNNKIHSNGNILSEFSRVNHCRLHSTYHQHALTTHPYHAEQIKGRIPFSSVLADARFIVFRDWFSQEIPKTSATVLVAGMNGAFLEGALHYPTEEIFNKIFPKLSKNQPDFQTINTQEDYYNFLCTIEHKIKTLLPTCINIQSHLKKALDADNLILANTQSEQLQQLLSHSENHNISLLISIAIQDSIQKALQINKTTSSIHEQISILFNICYDTVNGMKQLSKIIQKSKHFIKNYRQ